MSAGRRERVCNQKTLTVDQHFLLIGVSNITCFYFYESKTTPTLKSSLFCGDLLWGDFVRQ